MWSQTENYWTGTFLSRIFHYLRKDSGNCIKGHSHGQPSCGCFKKINGFYLRLWPSIPALPKWHLYISPTRWVKFLWWKVFEMQIHKHISSQKSFKSLFNPIFLKAVPHHFSPIADRPIATLWKQSHWSSLENGCNFLLLGSFLWVLLLLDSCVWGYLCLHTRGDLTGTRESSWLW